MNTSDAYTRIYKTSELLYAASVSIYDVAPDFSNTLLSISNDLISLTEEFTAKQNGTVSENQAANLIPAEIQEKIKKHALQIQANQKEPSK